MSKIKVYDLFAIEYIIISIIIITIGLSLIQELPRKHPTAFFELTLGVLGLFYIYIIIINYQCINSVYSIKIKHIISFVIVQNLVYGLVYYALFNMDHTSFSGKLSLDTSKGTDFGSYFDMIYFSATTFFTVGYGDITPVSRVARGLVLSQYIASFILISILLRIAIM